MILAGKAFDEMLTRNCTRRRYNLWQPDLVLMPSVVHAHSSSASGNQASLLRWPIDVVEFTTFSVRPLVRTMDQDLCAHHLYYITFHCKNKKCPLHP
ncbi:hypothetical protein U9M48_003218 [Paspalum notatum var. saurae]|uniref:Uncharacterized protein n=1 Tax=Paspalum notatum var. saurae TaxID=547442 RepID=A0AAQ3SKG4_PASNO